MIEKLEKQKSREEDVFENPNFFSHLTVFDTSLSQFLVSFHDTPTTRKPAVSLEKISV